jgi:hypothetical protein
LYLLLLAASCLELLLLLLCVCQSFPASPAGPAAPGQERLLAAVCLLHAAPVLQQGTRLPLVLPVLLLPLWATHMGCSAQAPVLLRLKHTADQLLLAIQTHLPVTVLHEQQQQQQQQHYECSSFLPGAAPLCEPHQAVLQVMPTR